MYDAIVVGGGPAGLSAATWLARYRRKLVLVDSGQYRNGCVEQAHGYLGADPVEPAALRARSRRQLLAYDHTEVIEGRAESAAGSVEDGFDVEVDGRSIGGLRLVLATGVVDELPDVDGFTEHYGASAFHCPSCDGYETRGAPVAVFGWGEQVAGFALGLLEWASAVTVVTDGRPFEGDERHRRALAEHGVAVLTDEAVALEGPRGDLRCVRLRDGRPVEAAMAFFSIAHHPVTDLADQLGCARTGEGYIEVHGMGETSVPGVYAAGDVTPGCQMVQVAAADGAVAGSGAALSLQGETGAPGSPRPAPEGPQ